MRPAQLSPTGVSCDTGHSLSLPLPTPSFWKKGHWFSMDILAPYVGDRHKLICFLSLSPVHQYAISWTSNWDVFLGGKPLFFSANKMIFFCHLCSICPLCGALSASFWDLPLSVYSLLPQGLSTWTDTVHCPVSGLNDMSLVLTFGPGNVIAAVKLTILHVY